MCHFKTVLKGGKLTKRGKLPCRKFYGFGIHASPRARAIQPGQRAKQSLTFYFLLLGWRCSRHPSYTFMIKLADSETSLE